MSPTAQLVWGGIVGVAASFVASVIFAVSTIVINVPKITIAPVLARAEADARNNYRIKIVNRKRRAAVDIQATAFMAYAITEEHGESTRLQQIELKATPGFSIMGYKRKDRQARYARRIRIVDDIDAIYVGRPGRCLIFRVLARDSFSGATKLFERVYSLDSDVRDGSFRVGKSCDVS